MNTISLQSAKRTLPLEGVPNYRCFTTRRLPRGFATPPFSAPGQATNSIFLFPFCDWFAWRANFWPLIEEKLFSYVPPNNSPLLSLLSVSDPWTVFSADKVPFKGPRLASGIASGTTEKHEHSQVGRASCRGCTVKNSWHKSWFFVG